MQALYETVKDIIASGRIGVPVFVRCLVLIPHETELWESSIGSFSENSLHILARITAIACSWLDASPLVRRDSHRAFGKSSSKFDETFPKFQSTNSNVYILHNQKHINITVNCKGGQTAIIGLSLVSCKNPCLDLMLLGNKGGIYHDMDTISPEFDETFSKSFIAPERLMQAIKRAFSEGRPVTLEEVKGYD